MITRPISQQETDPPEDLRRVVRHAVRKVPVYTRVEEQLGSEPELAQLPLVDAETILRRFGDYRSRDSVQYAPELARQTEPSGLCLALLQDAKLQQEIDEEWRERIAGPDPPVAVILGEPPSLPGRACIQRRFPQARVIRPTKKVTTHSRAELLDLLDTQPGVLVASSSIMDSLAAISLAESEHRNLSAAVHLVGPPLARWQIQRIGKAFGVVARQHLEWFEGTASAHSEGDFIIPSDRTYTELLPVEGATGASSQTGALVLSCSSNHSMPLLRYRTGYLAHQPGPGRELQLLVHEDDLRGDEKGLNAAALHLARIGIPEQIWTRVHSLRIGSEGHRIRVLLSPPSLDRDLVQDLRSWIESETGSCPIEIVHSRAD